jgi:PQQ-dependent dehydrogenase (methanol/ethanol family)
MRLRMSGWTPGTLIIVTLVSASFFAYPQESSPDPESQFGQLCASCHGPDAAGGDRAPALANSRALRTRTAAQIGDTIRNGTPGGMPPFALPAAQLTAIATWVRSLNVSAADAKPPGDAEAGRQFFFGKGQCTGCHMVRGIGKPNGPDLSDVGGRSTVREMEAYLDNPTSQIGIHTTPSCPGWAFCPDETWRVVTVHLRNGSTIRGFARNQTNRDIQLQGLDGQMHLLTSSDYERVEPDKVSYMPVLQSTPQERQNLIAYLSSLAGPQSGPLPEAAPIDRAAIEAVVHPKSGEWPNYDGRPDGNRYSTLTQIDRTNVNRLQLKWIYSMQSKGIEMTPVVADGMMYVMALGEVCGLDAGAGREVWCYKRNSPSGTPGGRAGGGAPAAPAGGGGSRRSLGVTVVGDRVIYETGDARLVCLNRLTGAVMWDVPLMEGAARLSAPSDLLVVGDVVVAGMAGGDGPIRGFLDAFQISTGALAWRFWTIPKPREPLSETWQGTALPTGGGATWSTGSYDPETDTVYWAVGNPFPATDGDERKGVNLYTNCVLALEAKTGKLRWYYQFSPHDLHDWDATEPLVLVDTTFQGRPRKLLIEANRNGFYYVLDRTNGQFLLAKPFVEKMNWASGFDKDGKPVLLPANFPTKEGVKTCPAVRGATNWYSSSYSLETRLFYVMAVEDCSIYRQSGRGGYEGYRNPEDPGKRYLRAIDIDTGKVVWEVPQIGAQEANYTGVLSTAGGIVFYGETGGSFAAADSRTGRLLWNHTSNEPWKASPMTYTTHGRQYVSIVSGGDVLSFALNDLQ